MIFRYFQFAFQAFAGTSLVCAAIDPAELESPRFTLSDTTLEFTVANSGPSRTYQLQWSDTLAPNPWENIEAALAGNGGQLIITTPRIHDAPKRFYRLKLEEVTPPRDGFSLIPAGSFQMGDQSNPVLGATWEKPVHAVNVSAFYMAKHEVTKALWDEVRTWGLSHGYADLVEGSVVNGTNYSKGPDHPVHLVSWWDMIKWCNARSEMDELTPCYQVNGQIMRTGFLQPTCDWSANGYRLPTEAEWEKAARGTLTARNFPGGDTISHANANYYNSIYPYESPQDQGYHPDYATGAFPFTAPVGSFNPNGYGLHDMAGNVWEWCWDNWSSTYYSTSPASNPKGPSTTSDYRVMRGSSWDGYADYCRVAARDYYYVGYSEDYIGFRVAYSLTP